MDGRSKVKWRKTRTARRASALVAALALGACQNMTTENVLESAGDSENVSSEPLTATFLDPAWDGTSIPTGQQCRALGGYGKTPQMIVSNLPEGTRSLQLAFDALDKADAKNDAEFGVIAFDVQAGASDIILPTVSEQTRSVPIGSTIVADNTFAPPGYLAPCKTEELTVVDLTAFDADGTEIAERRIVLGTL